MAQNATYTRRINLYINGKEVKNDVKSIRSEMQKAIIAQSKMTIGSQEYIREGKKIQALNAILKQHKQQLYQTATGWNSIGNAVDKFNKYFGIITTGIASLTGIAFGFRKAADAYNTFEERLDNLSALTGLEGDELGWLGEQAKLTSVKVTEAGIKIKQGASDILDAYTMVGSQRPELLKNKEALAYVTEQAIILSEAAKSKLEPAAGALTNTMNQFNMEADQSNRVINVLAAGSKEGAANIPYLSQAIEKMGTTFALMGGEVEQAVGLIEAVAPKFKEAAVSGNSLDKVLLKMKAKQIGYKNGVFDVNRALLELETRFKKGESATDIFGEEHAKMAEVLVQARTEVERYTQAVTDTNVAQEQAYKNTNNNATTLQQAKNEVMNLAIELGENLSPVLTKSIWSFGKLIKVAIALPKVLKENQTLIIALTGAVLAYNASLIKAAAAQAAKIAMDIKEKAISAGIAAISTARVLGMQAYIAVTGKATVAQRRFIDSQKAWGGALSINPLSAAIAGITALYLAIKAYDKYNAGAIKREKEKKEAVEKLTKANKQLKDTYNDLNNQISNLNSLSIQQKKYLQDKINKTIELAEAELLLQQTRQDEIRENNTRVNTWQFVKNSLLSAGNAAAMSGMMTVDAFNNGEEAANAMNEGIKDLQMRLQSLKRQQTDLGEILNAEQIGDQIGTETLANLEQKMSKYQLALKHATRGGEDYLRIQKKIAQVQKEMEAYTPDITNPEDEKAIKKLADNKAKAEKDLANKIIEIRRRLHLDTLSDEAKEIQAIKDKYADLYNVAQKYSIDTSELESLQNQEIEAKQAEHNQKRLKLHSEIEQKLYEMSLNDFEREKQAKINQYQELLRLAEENGLVTSEYYQLMLEELEVLRNTEEPRDIFGMTQEDWEAMLENIELAKVALDQVVGAWSAINQIQGNKEKKELKQFERNTNKKKDLLNDQLEKGLISQNQYNAKTAKLDADLDRKKEEIAIKQAKREKSLKIFEATINTASAIIKMLADPGGFAGLALSTMAGITGALQIAAISSEPLPAYATGGFTNGDRIYRAGEEGTEWIASNQMVNDPYTGPVIAALEAVRKGKAPASMFGGVTPDFAAMQDIPAFANGGFTNKTEAPVVNIPQKDDSILIERIDMLIEENRELRNYLSDPLNRRSYITNTDLDDKTKEDEERASIASIK